MGRRAIVKGLLATVLGLTFAPGIGAAEEKKAVPAGLEEALKKFADAVKSGKYEEVAKWITPPADKIWTNIPPLQSAIAKYEAALDQKFGKSEDPSPLRGFPGTNLADHYYESRGTIREVKVAGKDRVHVTVWTMGRVFGETKDDAIYERKFTAVKIDGQWKFQLDMPMGGGPVVKKVKRTTPEGQEIEVYAEHDPKGSPDQKNWEELKPTNYDGQEEGLKQYATALAKFTEFIQMQTEQVQKGTYQTRKEALSPLEKEMRKLR